ncbi:Argonaute complex, subunit Arb1 [Nemania sp. FL0031]|nr:Argonaute complex, subunit Arb1 [Nemania sp. FL0031]
MTPAEAAVKTKLYDPARPFTDRIEECIQRFRARRRLNSQRAAMFNKYLFLGGIDSSQRQFTGMARDKDAMAEADSEQVRTMKAVDFVGGNDYRFYNPSNPDDWEVDFEAIVKGFLSRSITDLYMYDANAIQIAADLIKNFLNYVLMQDACPEYAGNVVAARNVCDIAPTELRHTHELILELPGTFNCACRSLFCEGRVEHLDEQENYETIIQFRLTTLLWSLGKEAKEIKEQIIEARDPTTIKVISTTEETYQVLEIERPRHKDKMTVDEQLKKKGLNGKHKPAGFIRVAPAIMEHGWGNVPRPEEIDLSDADEEEYVLEDELLAKFEVGMKIHMTVCKLNVGLCFIKEVHDIRVSFDTFLPQYLMADWKDAVPNERPPPSIHDPDAEERVLSAETEE